MKLYHQQVGMIGTNCYLVQDEESGRGVVIDPGDDAGRILQGIAEHGIHIDYILLTHGHFDHILAVHDVAEKTGAQVVIHQLDAYRLKAEELLAYKPYLRDAYQEKLADIQVQDGDTISFGGLTARFIHTPGHTEGSCLIEIADCLFTGDTLFRREIGRCDLPGGDYNTMLRSLKKIAQIPGDYAVYPGHEGFSTLQEEREHNRYLKMVMQS